MLTTGKKNIFEQLHSGSSILYSCKHNTLERLEKNVLVEKYHPEKDVTNRNAEYLDRVALLQSLSDEKSFCQQLPIAQSSFLTLLCGIVIEKRKIYYFKFQCIYTHRKWKFEDFKLPSKNPCQLTCVTLKDYWPVGFLRVKSIGVQLSAKYMNYRHLLTWHPDCVNYTRTTSKTLTS